MRAESLAMGDRRLGRNPSGGAPIVPPPPPPPGPGPPRAPGSDPLTTFIPYDNPKALAAYYLAISALIPGVGLFTGVAAAVLGLQGLAAARERPEVRGRVHAWIGIVLGGFLALANLAAVVLLLWGIVGLAREV
jgi:hypothetical protein